MALKLIGNVDSLLTSGSFQAYGHVDGGNGTWFDLGITINGNMFELVIADFAGIEPPVVAEAHVRQALPLGSRRKATTVSMCAEDRVPIDRYVLEAAAKMRSSLSSKECCEYLGVSLSTWYQLKSTKRKTTSMDRSVYDKIIKMGASID